jgi:sporulation protein YqfC
LADWLDLPHHLVLNIPYVAITGGAQVLVENHGGIQQLESQRIVVGRAGSRITIQGEELVIALVTKDELLVRGRIRGISWE